MESPAPPEPGPASIPPTLRHPAAARFWLAALVTGAGTGAAAAALTRLLEAVQRLSWGGDGTELLASAARASAGRHLAVLALAGVVTGAGQLALRRLASGNGIDTTAAIWFHAGRMPALRSLGSAVLSVILVGMGVSLGREGAPKQAGAVLAGAAADAGRLSDEQRRLLVACGAGAGMAAAYGVPLGGALFALEVMRGALALRTVLPALVTSIVATGVAWLVLPDVPTYPIPGYASSGAAIAFAIVLGPVAGLASVGWVRLVRWADRHRPRGAQRLVAPLLVMAALGAASIPLPQLLGNGRDVSLLAFTGPLAAGLLLPLLLGRAAATLACLRSGAPGGLFTPSLTVGALLGATLGAGWAALWPAGTPGLFAVLGAGAVLAATTQGPISSVVLLMELTGRDRSFILPLLVAVAGATLVSRTLEPRSVYEARLSDEEVAARLRWREAQWGARR